jgi:hypothetical protein
VAVAPDVFAPVIVAPSAIATRPSLKLEEPPKFCATHPAAVAL